MINFTLKHPRATLDMLGYIPLFLSENNPLPAKEQFNHAYSHGGGWTKFEGHVLSDLGLKYPGDPMRRLIAEAQLRDETIRVYEGAWVAIIQKDGTYEIARLD